MNADTLISAGRIAVVRDVVLRVVGNRLLLDLDTDLLEEADDGLRLLFQAVCGVLGYFRLTSKPPPRPAAESSFFASAMLCS